VTRNFGDGNTQWNNTFSNGGPAMAGNLIPTVKGAPAVLPYNVPQGSTFASVKGGRRGGNLGHMVGTAVVPLGLLALQNKYSRRRGFSTRRRGSKRGRSSRRNKKSRR
jgi:hypothetical protein